MLINGKQKPSKYRKILPYVALMVLFSLTIYVCRFWSKTVTEKEQLRYGKYTDIIASYITERLHDYMMILQGGAALFTASEDLTRSEWRAYYESMQVGTSFPGVQGVGFSMAVQPSQLARHIHGIRAEGFPDYMVWPAGEREVYTAIIFLEPFDARNQRAFGYDMFQEPVRRAAMEHARDTGTSSISGKVTLVQETDKDAQAGFLMYVPIYTKGMPLNSVEERRAALKGYVYSPFRMGDLIRGVFPDPIHDIDFEIYDGTEVSPAALMYDNDTSRSAPDEKREPMFSNRKTMNLYGHQWTLTFSTRPAFEAAVDRHTSKGILVTGTLISLLAFLLIRTFENTQKRAFSLAQSMTSALRDSEEKYRILNDSLPYGVSIIGPNMEILAANATKRRWFSDSVYSQHPLCYATYNFPSRTEPCEGCPVVKTFHDSQVHTAEREATTLQGKRILSITTTPLTVTDGKVISVHETVEDITERKRGENIKEARLRILTFSEKHSSEELLRATLDELEILTGSQISFYDFMEADQQTVSLQTWSTRTLREFCTAEGRGRHYDLSEAGVWADCVRERRPVIHNDYDSLSHRKGIPTGHPIIIRELVIPIIREGQIVAIIGLGNKTEDYTEYDIETVSSLADLLWDIIERKLAEEKIRKSEERYHSTLDQMLEGCQILGFDWRYLYLNAAAEKHNRRSNGDLLGKKYMDMWPGIEDTKVFKIIRRCMEERIIQRLENEFIFPDGTTGWFELSIQPVSEGIFILSHDITERKRAEEENKKLGAKLQQAQKMEAIGTLAGGIAHDFNNILTAIIGYTELSLNTVPEDSLLHSDLTKIYRAGNRARGLISQILTFSRQREQEKRPILIAPIIKEALKLLRASLPSSIEIRQDIESESGTVLADPIQIHQVIMNLCTNAGHAMRDKGGILEVSLSSMELDSGFSLAHPGLIPGLYLRLMVSDTGHGIPPDILPKIFEPYFTTKEKSGGTGLGLSVVHGIVSDCGGIVTVYSELGKGTTFKVYLPVITEKPVVETERKPSLAKGHERILFVDDEKDIIDVGKRILEQLGYTVTTVSNGMDALELFQKDPNQFDLVITDMTMPFMTGDELAVELMRIRQDIPIIVCTGYSEKLTEEKALRIGIKAYMGKPLFKSEMAETVRRVLDQQSEEN